MANRMEFKEGPASAVLVFTNGFAEARLCGLWCDDPGKGHGTRLMKRIVEVADSQGITIHLRASPYGSSKVSPMSLEKLIDFYGRFGFKQEFIDGLNKMVRYPSREKQTL